MSEFNPAGRDGSRSLKPGALRNACSSRDASALRFVGGLRIAVLLLSAALVASAPASAQQAVRVDLVDGFGTSHHAFVIAEVRNQTNQLLQGHVEISVSGWSTSSARYRLPADLPPQSTRNFQFELPPVEGSVEARFVAGGSEYGRWQDGWGGSGQPVIVVIAERANVRSTLSSLEGTEITDYGSTRQVNYDVGRVSFDSSGDPIAPRTLAGWRGVSMVTATTRDLQRLSPEQLDALYEYVWTGGRLVLSQSAPEDTAAESVRRFAGDLRPGVDPRGEPTWNEESFGGARSVGFGITWYVERDLDSPTVAADAETQQMLSEMLSMTQPVLTRPQARFFQGERMNSYGGDELNFDALRASLDPNESFRPALGFVAIVLFLYIFLVGPINFGYVKKRGKPTLALMTTPLIALGCLAVMLLVGYIGKGITMRYRSVALIETVAESALAQQRTYRGLFSTRPTNYDIPAGGYSTIVGNQRELLQDQSPERRGSIEDIRSSLWETVFVREERIIDMGQGIRFEGAADGSVTRVFNGSGVAIHSALIVSPGGQVYEVGELPAGGRALVAPSPTFVLRSPYHTMNPMDHEALHGALGFGEDEQEMFEGLLSLTSGAASQTPTLYGRVDPSGDAYAIFAEERSLALLCVQMATPPVGGFSQVASEPAFSEDMDPLMLLQPEEMP